MDRTMWERTSTAEAEPQSCLSPDSTQPSVTPNPVIDRLPSYSLRVIRPEEIRVTKIERWVGQQRHIQRRHIRASQQRSRILTRVPKAAFSANIRSTGTFTSAR